MECSVFAELGVRNWEASGPTTRALCKVSLKPRSSCSSPSSLDCCAARKLLSSATISAS
ncbi:Uncharacterized protein DAT39_015265, partial [Clarias magur]